MTWPPLWLSLQVASLATLLATFLGLVVALWLAESNTPARSAAESLTALPLLLPPTVLGYYLLVVLGRESALGAWFERITGSPIVFTWYGAVVASAVASFPYIVRTARAALEEVAVSVREAARIDGASRLYLLVFIQLPLARKGITAGIALAFARALGEFGATLMVAGNIPGRTQTMPLAIYDAVQAGRLETANTLVVVLSVAAVVILWLVGRLGATA